VPEVVAPRPAVGAERLRPRGIRLAERSDLGKIDLRGDAGDRAFMSAVGRCLELVLPSEPVTSASRGGLTAIWLGPDEWLITCPRDDLARHMQALREALQDVHAAITDVSDGRVAFRLSGPSARETLAKGCPLDLHPAAFRPGMAAQSLLAKASVLIHLVEDEAAAASPAFDVYVGRSFAHYLFAWLEDAGREYGVQVESLD
jgi:sarcosine oxidase, subunit gamma